MRNTLFIFFILLATAVQAQDRIRSLAPRVTATEAQQTTLDRAIGVINVGGIGHTITNYARFYASPALGPRGEYPVGSSTRHIQDWGLIIGMPGDSGKPAVAINSIFSRTGLEFTPETGYHNRDSVRIANSRLPYTWPSTGWPVRDQQGKPVVVSSQDLYMVYGDSTNNPVYGFKVEQLNYAFSTPKYRDIIFFRFLITNRSAVTRDSVWVGHYLDIDIGNLPDGDPEYLDDRISVDPSTHSLMFFDDGTSIETPDNKTYFMGLSTVDSSPTDENQTGMTDWHYVLYDDFFNDDNLIFQILSSSEKLHQSGESSKYFHIEPGNPSRRKDDDSTIPVTGLDITAVFGTGPYTLSPGETIEITYAMIAGKTREAFLASAVAARDLALDGYATRFPPESPVIEGYPGDNRNTLVWTPAIESLPDVFSGAWDFQGYKLYRSDNLGKTWVLLNTWDKLDQLGENTGIPYQYTDTSVVNGFTYWYSLTAFDTDPAYASIGEDVLESSIGSDPVTDEQLIILTPQALPAGLQPGSLVSFSQTAGSSQSLLVSPTQKPFVAPVFYTATTTPLARPVKGTYAGSVLVSVKDEARFVPDSVYRVRWTGSTEVVLSSLRVSELARVVYTPGTDFSFGDLFSLKLSDAGTTGDELIVGPAITVTSGGQVVLPTTPIRVGESLMTRDGNRLLFAGGTRVGEIWQFIVGAATTDAGNVRGALQSIKVVPNPYVIGNLFEPAYDRTLYSEPFRLIRFINLPSEATIHIFTVDGTRVTTLTHSSGSVCNWNLQNESRREIAPGIYLYQVRTRVGEIVGKFAVIK